MLQYYSSCFQKKYFVQHMSYFKVRDVLEIPKTSAKFKLDRGKLDDFDVFVQSTSYNRILVPDSEFLYDTGETEVKDDAGAPSTSTDTGLY